VYVLLVPRSRTRYYNYPGIVRKYGTVLLPMTSDREPPRIDSQFIPYSEMTGKMTGREKVKTVPPPAWGSKRAARAGVRARRAATRGASFESCLLATAAPATAGKQATAVRIYGSWEYAGKVSAEQT